MLTVAPWKSTAAVTPTQDGRPVFLGNLIKKFDSDFIHPAAWIITGDIRLHTVVVCPRTGNILFKLLFRELSATASFRIFWYCAWV